MSIYLEPFLFSNRNLNVDTNLENQYYLGKASPPSFVTHVINLHSVQPKESPLLQQLRADLKDKRMIVSKDQIHLSNVVGHGKQSLCKNFIPGIFPAYSLSISIVQ